MATVFRTGKYLLKLLDNCTNNSLCVCLMYLYSLYFILEACQTGATSQSLVVVDPCETLAQMNIFKT